MSRRRSTSNVMGPPPDRDIVMGPPVVPAPLSAPPQQKSKDSQELNEKYRKLKRRFFELEEKHKETSTELQRSGERNVKMREERNILLDRIIELESQPSFNANANGSPSVSPPPNTVPLAQPSSSAFPRTLLSARAHDDTDPHLTSRHVGPQARKREEDERKERLEEEAREAKKGGRKTRGSASQGSSSHKGKEPSSSASGQPLLTYTPSSHHTGPGVQGGSPHHPSTAAPVLVSSTGTRLRIKPPAPPTSTPPLSERVSSPNVHNAVASSSSSSSSRAHSNNQQSPLPSTHSHSHSYTHPPPPPPHFQQHVSSPQHRHEHQEHRFTPEPSVHEQDVFHQAPMSSGGELDHEMDDGVSRGEYDHPPSPNDSHSHHSSGSPNKHNHEECDLDTGHHSNGNTDPGINVAGASPSVPSDGGIAANNSGPAYSPRENSRSRRSSVSGADTLSGEPQADDSRALSPPLVSARKAAPTTPVSTRTTRSETAAMAAAAASEAAQRESSFPSAHEHPSSSLLPSAQSSLTPARDPSPLTPPSPSVGSMPPDSEDVNMGDDTQEALAMKEETPGPTSVPSASPAPPSVLSSSPPFSKEATVELEQNSVPGPAEQASSDSLVSPGPPPPTPASLSAESSQADSIAKDRSPAMDSIVKVAEAAVAAQNATSNTPYSNVDPVLMNATGTSPPIPGSNSTSHNYQTVKSNATGSSSSSSSASGSTPTMPMTSINPYSLYYPSPGTPVTPNTPTYAHPYANPYYYMGPAPMAPGPSGLYAPGSNYVPPNIQRQPSETQRHAKPKRLKAHTVTSKSFSIPMVPRDKKGKPMLPLNVGIMTVINLGDVCMREHFHTERYIFPVGYEVTRRYLSTVDANMEVVYHCTILDGGDGPKFQIVPSDVPDRPVIAGTATGAWSNIVKQANAIRNRQHSNSVSGPDFFGLGQNTIKHLIQELPNSDRLRDYVWQHFVEGGPLGGRHAAVIPALPEEYDASMPIGAYYPSERDKLKREATAPPESPRGHSHYPQHILAQAEAQRQGTSPGGSQQPQKKQKHHQTQQQVQQGLTQIVLPPPTTSEMLNIQEYQPPAVERRSTRNTSGSSRTASESPAPTRGTRQTSRSPSVRGEPHLTRSSSRSQAQAQAQAQHSPYLANVSAPVSSASPPPVPATFASIMNAYPVPGPGNE